MPEVGEEELEEQANLKDPFLEQVQEAEEVVA